MPVAACNHHLLYDAGAPRNVRSRLLRRLNSLADRVLRTHGHRAFTALGLIVLVALGACDRASNQPGVQFVNLPWQGVVQITKMDGTLLRDLPVDKTGILFWDLRVDGANPVAGGRYRARVQGRDASGRSVAPQLLYFGVVRLRAKQD